MTAKLLSYEISNLGGAISENLHLINFQSIITFEIKFLGTEFDIDYRWTPTQMFNLYFSLDYRRAKGEYFKMVAINQVISENPKKSQIPISEVSITVENSSSATDTTSKTTEGTNSKTTEDCSIEDISKQNNVEV